MNVTGANTTELLQLEKNLASMIERLDTASSRGPSFASRLASNWLGPLANLFNSTWQHTDLPSINQARDSLQQLKDQLTANRDDQERTSGNSTPAPLNPWAGEHTFQLKTTPAPDVSATKRELNEAMNGWGTDEDRIRRALQGLTPAEQKALRNDTALMERLNRELDRGDMLDVMKRLDVDPKSQLTEAMNDMGTDESAIREILRSASPDEKRAIYNDTELMSRLDSELGDGDYAEVQQLIDPNAMELHFDGEKLVATNVVTGEIVEEWDAVSGAWANGAPVAGPEHQAVKDFGPIPEGRWSIDPGMQQDRSVHPDFQPDGHPRPASAWGNSRTIIEPEGWTDAMNRDLMYTHGGESPGSIGCVDLTDQNDDFQQWVAEQDGPINMVVDYDDFGVDYSDGRD